MTYNGKTAQATIMDQVSRNLLFVRHETYPFPSAPVARTAVWTCPVDFSTFSQRRALVSSMASGALVVVEEDHRLLPLPLPHLPPSPKPPTRPLPRSPPRHGRLLPAPGLPSRAPRLHLQKRKRRLRLLQPKRPVPPPVRRLPLLLHPVHLAPQQPPLLYLQLPQLMNRTWMV